MEIRLRPATLADANAINEIHNHYVRTSTATWQTDVDSEDQRRQWLKGRGPQHPVIVATIGPEVVGWGSLSMYNTRKGWSGTVEDSVFIHHAHQGKGLGKLILSDLLHRAKELGYHSVMARISGEQTPSLRLHESLGFVRSGLLPAVGFKFGQKLDCAYLLKKLS
jgi:phosphinothricin acetyltransferase